MKQYLIMLNVVGGVRGNGMKFCVRQNTVDLSFSAPSFKVFHPFHIQFQCSQVSNLSAKLSPFKILLSLALNSSVNQRDCKWGLHCIH
jgi:hypothetical protein